MYYYRYTFVLSKLFANYVILNDNIFIINNLKLVPIVGFEPTLFHPSH